MKKYLLIGLTTLLFMNIAAAQGYTSPVDCGKESAFEERYPSRKYYIIHRMSPVSFERTYLDIDTTIGRERIILLDHDGRPKRNVSMWTKTYQWVSTYKCNDCGLMYKETRREERYE